MVNPSPKFNFADQIELEDLGNGITRKILGYDESLLLAQVWFQSGSEGYAHAHPHSQITTVVSGRFKVTIDGETAELCAGDTFYVIPNKIHGMTCIEAGSVIDSFSPVREDFLERHGP